jgi:hypothetical protein
MYLPIPVLGALSAGLMSASIRDGLAAAVRDVLNGVNASLDPVLADRTAAVASSGSLTRAIPPLVRPITSVKCGRVPDTMRSRRGDLLEGYVSIPVTA